MEKWLWRLFYLQLVTAVISVIALPFGFSLTSMFPYSWVVLGLPFLLLISHSIYTLGWRRAILIMALPMLVGWLMEAWGLKDGTIFGGRYVYGASWLTLGPVPLPVVIYWAVFIYTGYSVVNSWVYWRKLKKPSYKQKNLWQLILLIALDGLVVTAIDLFMDPIQVSQGVWRWLDGGSYFSVPVGNFVGWFLTTIIATGIFRIWEYFKPVSIVHDHQVYLIPLVGYFLLAISFSISALLMNWLGLLLFGLIFMLTPVFISWSFYKNSMKKEGKL